MVVYKGVGPSIQISTLQELWYVQACAAPSQKE